MPVNHEIKSQLARLLATEDLMVEHKKVETACFNVHTRVLTLPMWEKASGTVYDLLVSHECGHALETPNEDWTETHKIPPQFVNIVEDARIEKLMKRRYPGLAKTFYNGYQELYDDGFFALGDDDVNSYNLADRANLYFKIGNFLNINFTPKEKEIIDIIYSANTFAEALNAAEVLYKYCKTSESLSSVPDMDGDFQVVPGDTDGSSDQQTSSSGNSIDAPNPFQSEDNSDSSEGKPDNSQQTKGSDGPSSNSPNSQNTQSSPGSDKQPEKEPEVKTVQSLEDALKDLVGKGDTENMYVEVPELDLKNVVISNSEIHKVCAEYWSQPQRTIYGNYDVSDSPFAIADKEYLQFKSSAQKEVNYLVKEFECRKAADSYARASIARTGVLDCSRLHNYKFSEDLFKKVTTLADGKNHGLIFVLDWSGSMSQVMLDTVKQLFNLVWFCKKVSIPFEVYAFTNDYPVVNYEDGKAQSRMTAYRKREGVFQISEWFSMMNLLTSKVSGKILDDHMKNIYRMARYFGSSYSKYNIPPGMSLSGTPLNEAVMTLHEILPKFQRENKLQKVQCVILTDGEGSELRYHKEFHHKWESEPYLGVCGIGSGVFLRDRKTGTTYSMATEWWNGTNILLRNLRDKFPNTNFIGIRVMENREAGNFIRNYYRIHTPEYDKIMEDWRKNKAFAIKTSGYNTYFGFSSSTLSQDSEFVVSEGAAKTTIKNAFMKSFKAKKMNKKILGEFIELVA